MVFLLLQTLEAAGVHPRELPAIVTMASPKECSPEQDGEILVCGKAENSDAYRLKPLPDRYTSGDDRRASIRLSDKEILAADSEQADIAGAPSNRLMVRYRLKF